MFVSGFHRLYFTVCILIWIRYKRQEWGRIRGAFGEETYSKHHQTYPTNSPKLMLFTLYIHLKLFYLTKILVGVALTWLTKKLYPVCFCSLLRHQRPSSHLAISVIILLLFGHMKVGRMLRNAKLVMITVGRTFFLYRPWEQ